VKKQFEYEIALLDKLRAVERPALLKLEQLSRCAIPTSGCRVQGQQQGRVEI
jgi:hypothetical protein